MIGFFEHQYLSFKKNHIRNLLALAQADGHMHPKEEELLFRIGRRYGLKDRQIRAIVESETPHTLSVPEKHDDKMNLIYDLLLMIHADDRIAEHELAFVEDAVSKFGMKKEMVPWLLEFFGEAGIPPGDWEDIKLEAGERFRITE